MSFSYQLELDGTTQIIKLNGRILDRSEADDLMEEVSKNIEAGKNKVICNFSGLEYMNSSGLNVLISILNKNRNHYGEMAICNLSDKVKNLLVTSKLQNIFKMVDTEAEAKELLNS